MTLDLDKLCDDLAEFSTIMGHLGIPCRVMFDVSGVPLQVRVVVPPDHTIKNEVMEFPPEKKAAAPPSPAPKKKKDPVKPPKMIKCLFCERSMDRRSLHQHISKSHRDLYKKDQVSRYIKWENAITIQGIDQDLLEAVPEVRPRTRGDPKDPAPGPAAEFVSGLHVKTTQLFKGISPGTIGTVRKRLGKNIEVNFGQPGYREIPEGLLEAL